jgi:hypothetical protein
VPSRDSLLVSATPSSTAGGAEAKDPPQAGPANGRLPDGPVGERLESQLTWYDKRAQSSQRWFTVLKVTQIVVAAAIPVVAAAGGSAAVAGAMGAVIVVLEGLQQLFQFQQNWTRYRSTCEALKHEKFLFLAHVDPYAGANSEQLLAARTETLLSQETSAWRAQRDRDVSSDTGDKSGGSK